MTQKFPKKNLRSPSNGKKKSTSSKRWLQRHARDPYVRQALKEGFRARSAFKLKEMQKKYKVFKPGETVLDLGAAPGGWAEIALAEICSDKRPFGGPAKDTLAHQGFVLGVDLLPIKPLEGAWFLQADLREEEALERVATFLAEHSEKSRVDVVLSDMAPSSMGHQQTDHLRAMALAELAFEWAQVFLKPGGVFVCKVFQGADEPLFRQKVRGCFDALWVCKPEASRLESAEVYYVGQGFQEKCRNKVDTHKALP